MARPLAAQVIVAGAATGKVTGAVGDLITVPLAVDLTGAPGVALGAYQLRLAWTPSRLQFVRMEPGAMGVPTVNADSAAQGVLRLAAANASGLAGQVTLASVTLQVLAAQADTFRLTFGALAAAQTFTDLLPFLTVTPGAFCLSSHFGDLDGNGLVQALDAQIVAMHAVGLAVSDTTTGDVDGDGRVNTRDALIILSEVVGLDVSAFRVGQVVPGACSAGPASLHIAPSQPQLAAGDVLPLRVDARDTLGHVIAGLQLAWASTAPSVATVDTAGRVTAVGAGTTVIMAAMAPGVTDTTTVTVGPRHTWYVNPPGAAGQPAELGSTSQPFSTIAAAVSRAGAGDTVRLAPVRYTEPLVASKPLVVMGDTTVGGAGPTIGSLSGPVAALLLASGRVEVWRVHFSEGLSGVAVTADTAVFRKVTIDAIQGAGLHVHHAMLADLDGVTVNGALQIGVFFDTVGVARVRHVQIAGVERITPDDTLPALGLAAIADTLLVDSTSVNAVDGPALWTKNAALTRVQHSSLGVARAGIEVEQGITADIGDSVFIHDLESAGGIAAWADTLRVHGTRITNAGGVAVYSANPLASVIALDSVAVQNTVYGLYGEGGRLARIRHSTFDGIDGDALDPETDSVYVDTVAVSHANGVGLYVGGVMGSVTGSSFTSVLAGIEGYYGATSFVMTGSSISDVNGGDGVYVAADTMRLIDDTVTQVRDGSGVVDDYGAARLEIRGGRYAQTDYEGIYAAYVNLVEIVGATIDSTYRLADQYADYSWGVDLESGDSVRVDSISATGNGAGVLGVFSTRAFAAYGGSYIHNRRNRIDDGGYSYAHTIVAHDVTSAVIRHNTVLDNAANGIAIEDVYVDGNALVDSNTVRGRYYPILGIGPDSLTGHVEVRHNAVTGDVATGLTGIGLGPFRSMMVDSNQVDSTGDVGISAYPGDSTFVRGNQITAASGTAGIFAQRGSALAEFSGNSITCVDNGGTMGIVYHTGGGLIANNVVSTCWAGGFSANSLATSGVRFTLDIVGNLFDAAGATNLPAAGYQTQSGGYDVTFLRDTVRGGAYTFGALTAIGAAGYPTRAFIDSNFVGLGSGNGIKVGNVDTALISRNTVDGLAAAGTGTAAILVASTTTTGLEQIQILGDTVRNNAVGVRVAAGQGIAIDSSIITDNTVAGVAALAPLVIVRSSLLRNAIGVVDSSAAGGSIIDTSNIAGNAFGVINLGSAPLVADSDWWGDATGPAFVGCPSSCLGDSVSNNVSVGQIAGALLASIPGAGSAPPPAFRAAAMVAGTGGHVGARRSTFAGTGSDLLPVQNVAALGGGGAQKSAQPAAVRAAPAPTAAGHSRHGARSVHQRPAVTRSGAVRRDGGGS